MQVPRPLLGRIKKVGHKGQTYAEIIDEALLALRRQRLLDEQYRVYLDMKAHPALVPPALKGRRGRSPVRRPGIVRDAAAALADNRSAIRRLVKRHHLSDVRVIGSVARGEAGPESDLDLLVRPGVDTSLLDLIALQRDLEARLGVPVQVVSEAALKPSVRDRILAEAVAV